MGYVRTLILALGACIVALSGAPPAWAQGGDPAIEALRTHSNHKVRIKAAKKLAGIKGPAARDALIAAVADQNALVRAAAANSLQRHPSGDSIGALCRLLGDKDDFVRRTATRALKGFGGTGGCPVWVRLEVTGDTAEMQAHVREKMTARLADDGRMQLTDSVPTPVANGVLKGYELKLRLERELKPGPAKLAVTCRISVSIFDLRMRNLRGSATQKGALKLDNGAPEAMVTKHLGACMDALAPHVHGAMTDFLARSRR